MQVLEILLEYGASVHVTDQDGNTPLLKTSKRNKKFLEYQSKQKQCRPFVNVWSLNSIVPHRTPKLLSRPNKKQRKDCEMWGAIRATPNINLHRSVPSLFFPLKQRMEMIISLLTVHGHIQEAVSLYLAHF